MSDDTRRMMMYDAQKKSVLLPYLLWFFLGYFGAHRFYFGKIGTGILQLLLTLIGGATTGFLGLGFIFVVPVTIWWVVDAFLIPGMARDHNVSLASRI